MHYADIDVIVSNPVLLVKVINALTKPQLRTNGESQKVQCIGEGIPVWTKEIIKDTLEPLRVEAGLEWKEVNLYHPVIRDLILMRFEFQFI